MKKIILFTLLAAALVGCKSKKEYQERFNSALDKMIILNAKSSVYIKAYTDIWKTAIYDKKFRGEYCSDFNYAINTYQDDMQNHESYKTFIDDHSKLKEDMRLLKDYPNRHKEAYNELVELFTLVDEYYSYAENISGSLTSYVQNTSNLSSEISKKRRSIEIKYKE